MCREAGFREKLQAMESKRQDNNAESLNSQGDSGVSSQQLPGNRNAKAPKNVIQLVDLVEIKERWGVGPDRVWRAAAQGWIHAYGRPGRQKYYSAAEIEAWLSSSVGGRQLRFFEFEDDALSA